METRLVEKRTSKRNLFVGLILVLLVIMLSFIVQLVLKEAMSEIGELQAGTTLMSYMADLLNVNVLLGLALYGIATVLCILCLSKLGLSFTYPWQQSNISSFLRVFGIF